MIKSVPAGAIIQNNPASYAMAAISLTASSQTQERKFSLVQILYVFDKKMGDN